MDIFEKLKEANDILNYLEEYYETIPNKQSKVDSELSDLYHYIENHNLNASQSCKLIKQIKRKRIERRKIKNDYELLRAYKTNCNKLSNKGSREILFCELSKTKKQLNYPYKNRVYTQEQFEMLNFDEFVD